MLDTSGHATIVIEIWVNGVEFIGQTRVGSFYKILMAACWCGDPRIQHKNQLSRQTGSRNLICPKTLPTIWYTYIKLVTKYQISAINSCWEKYLWTDGRMERQNSIPPLRWSRGIIIIPKYPLIFSGRARIA